MVAEHKGDASRTLTPWSATPIEIPIPNRLTFTCVSPSHALAELRAVP